MVKVVLKFNQPHGAYATGDIATFPAATAVKLLRLTGAHNEPVCVEVRRINPPPAELPQPPRTIAVSESREVIPEARPDKMVRSAATKTHARGRRGPAAKRKPKTDEPKDDE